MIPLRLLLSFGLAPIASTARAAPTYPSWLFESSAGDSYRPQIVGGKNHFCLLTPDGARCWDTRSGKPDAVIAPEFVRLRVPTAIWAGGDNTCALDQDGLHCWGTNAAIAKPPALRRVDQLALSDTHACAYDGKSYHCWGNADVLAKVTPRRLDYGDQSRQYDDATGQDWQENPDAMLQPPVSLQVGDGITCAQVPVTHNKFDDPLTALQPICLVAWKPDANYSGFAAPYPDGFLHILPAVGPINSPVSLRGTMACQLDHRYEDDGFVCVDLKATTTHTLVTTNWIGRKQNRHLHPETLTQNASEICAQGDFGTTCAAFTCNWNREVHDCEINYEDSTVDWKGAPRLATAGTRGRCGIVGDRVHCNDGQPDRVLELYFPIDRLEDAFDWMAEQAYADKAKFLKAAAQVARGLTSTASFSPQSPAFHRRLFVMRALQPAVASITSAQFAEKIAVHYQSSLERHSQAAAISALTAFEHDAQTIATARQLLAGALQGLAPYLANPSDASALMSALGQAITDPGAAPARETLDKELRAAERWLTPLAGSERGAWLAQTILPLREYLLR